MIKRPNQGYYSACFIQDYTLHRTSAVGIAAGVGSEEALVWCIRYWTGRSVIKRPNQGYYSACFIQDYTLQRTAAVGIAAGVGSEEALVWCIS